MHGVGKKIILTGMAMGKCAEIFVREILSISLSALVCMLALGGVKVVPAFMFNSH
ncbi:MAG: hypothetical protein ACI9I4_000762 [Neolewinella sp.]|jgi:hypothetical protein